MASDLPETKYFWRTSRIIDVHDFVLLPLWLKPRPHQQQYTTSKRHCRMLQVETILSTLLLAGVDGALSSVFIDAVDRDRLPSVDDIIATV